MILPISKIKLSSSILRPEFDSNSTLSTIDQTSKEMFVKFILAFLENMDFTSKAVNEIPWSYLFVSKTSEKGSVQLLFPGSAMILNLKSSLSISNLFDIALHGPSSSSFQIKGSFPSYKLFFVIVLHDEFEPFVPKNSCMETFFSQQQFLS